MKHLGSSIFCALLLVSGGSLAAGQSQTNPPAGLPRFVFITPEYSNAVLKATLPRFSEFAEKLKLPMPQPLSTAQVRRFKPSADPQIVGGWLKLTNGFEMWFEWGVVHLFRSPRNYFDIQDFSRDPEFYGPLHMTKEEAVAMAKATIQSLGYRLEDVTHGWPISVWGPGKQGTNVIPFYQVRWENPSNGFFTQIRIDGQNKTIVGLSLDTANIRRSNPKIDVVPRMDGNYWRHVRERALPAGSTNKPAFSAMSARTNAPARLPPPKLIAPDSQK